MLHEGILAKPTQKNIIRFSPPLIITEEQLTEACILIERAWRLTDWIVGWWCKDGCGMKMVDFLLLLNFEFLFFILWIWDKYCKVLILDCEWLILKVNVNVLNIMMISEYIKL